MSLPLCGYLAALTLPILLGLGIGGRAAHYARTGLRRNRCEVKR